MIANRSKIYVGNANVSSRSGDQSAVSGGSPDIDRYARDFTLKIYKNRLVEILIK